MAQNRGVALSHANDTLLETFTHLAQLAKSSEQSLTKFKENHTPPYSAESLQFLGKILINLQALEWKQKSAIFTIETLINYLLNGIFVSNHIDVSLPPPKRKKGRKPKTKSEEVPAEGKDVLQSVVESCGIPKCSTELTYDFPSYSVQFSD